MKQLWRILFLMTWLGAFILSGPALPRGAEGAYAAFPAAAETSAF